jgi:hypothetical protein
MMQCTVDYAVNLLVQANKSTPIGISYLIEPDHRKTDNPFYDKLAKRWTIEKVGEMSGMTGISYESAVNNQRVREDGEPDFEAFPLWKDKGIHLNKFLAYHPEKKRTYIKIMPKAIAYENGFATAAKVQYRHNTNKLPLTQSELEALLMFAPAKSVSDRQETVKPVFWQTIGLDSILQMRFAGECYEIR